MSGLLRVFFISTSGLNGSYSGFETFSDTATYNGILTLKRSGKNFPNSKLDEKSY